MLSQLSGAAGLPVDHLQWALMVQLQHVALQSLCCQFQERPRLWEVGAAESGEVLLCHW